MFLSVCGGGLCLPPFSSPTAVCELFFSFFFFLIPSIFLKERGLLLATHLGCLQPARELWWLLGLAPRCSGGCCQDLAVAASATLPCESCGGGRKEGFLGYPLGTNAVVS